MRYITLRLMVALLTFGLGLITYSVWSLGLHSREANKRVVPVSQLREEEWHKLYEAAAMTGDQTILDSVRGRLLCTNADGISDARLVEIKGRAACENANGTIYELNFIAGPYGHFDAKIMREHEWWALTNLRFLKTINTPQRARAYVIEHR
jgi:hypothetical protein